MLFIANPYHNVKRNTYILIILIPKSKIIFLGILSVPMQQLFTSEKTIQAGTHICPLFWLRDSAKTTQHLHHVPWGHLQIFQLKELTDVKIAHQVISSSLCESSEEMRSVSNIRSSFYVSLCFKTVGSEIELECLGIF